MIITKIKRLRGKRGRYVIYFDSSLTLELSDWTIGKFGLCTGDELDEERISKIRSAEAEAKAKNTAINYLSYRQRSSKEVRDHLLKKGFDPGCVEKTVHHLRDIKMLNDLNFAYAFIRDRLKRKPAGRILLRQQLLLKGIPSITTDKVLAELVSEQGQQSSALQAAKRKFMSTRYSSKKTDNEKQKKRLLDFLLRRGFSYEIASKTVKNTMGQ